MSLLPALRSGEIDAVERDVIGKKKDKRGCEFCPLNTTKGVRKIMGEITGKKVLVWSSAPGATENAQGQELIGRAAVWFWKQLRSVGLEREHCDVQSVVRCFPADRVDGRLEAREPSKAELHCCSTYTEQAIRHQQAKVWVVLGKVAAKALFGKGKRSDTFWYGDVRVFLLDHPSYFLNEAPPDRLVKFKALLKLAAASLTGGGKFDFGVHVTMVTTRQEAVVAVREILKLAASGRVAYDEEDDMVDGKKLLLCVGACPKPGKVWVFVMDHPENTASAADKAAVRKLVSLLLQHKHGKTMHHGSHDAMIFRTLLGTEIVNFDWDTNYSEFLFDPRHKSYALSAIVERKLPKYTGYKDIVQAAVPAGMTVEQGRDIGEFHLAKVTLKDMVHYNGMDCHVTKMIELGSAGAPAPLVRAYTDASHVVDTMQKFGPLLDYEHTQKMLKVFPREQEGYKDQLRKLAKDPELNPNSSKQMAELIYEQWGIRPVTDDPSTSKETLALMLARKEHPGLRALQNYRKAKNRKERIEAFLRSADAHQGRVTTFWWLTGAGTGRLSSGGGTRVDKRNLGNLQNIERYDLIKNMLVSTQDWREFVATASKHGLPAAIKKHALLDFFMSSDYSQMELRVLAYVTQEPEMLRVFQEGLDIHAEVGALWTGWSPQEIKEDDNKRAIVKGFHFGTVYGLTDRGLHQDLKAQKIKVSLQEVQAYREKYFKRMRRVAQYREDMPAFAREHDYVENLFGFKIPIAVSDERGAGAWWANQAVNAPIQGGAHQILLCALALMHRHKEKYKLIVPQMEVHDSLVSIQQLQHLEETRRVTQQLMEKDVLEMIRTEMGVSNWNVPLLADTKVGLRFGCLVKMSGEQPVFLQKMLDANVKQEQEMDTLLKKYMG